MPQPYLAHEKAISLHVLDEKPHLELPYVYGPKNVRRKNGNISDKFGLGRPVFQKKNHSTEKSATSIAYHASKPQNVSARGISVVVIKGPVVDASALASCASYEALRLICCFLLSLVSRFAV